MDVDEFLDKEMGLNSPQVNEDDEFEKELMQKDDPSLDIDEEITQEEDNFELKDKDEEEKEEKGDPFDLIEKSINDGNVEKAEFYYSKIWIELGKERFTWDKSRYERLIRIDNKLRLLAIKYHESSAIQIKNIQRLISQAKNLLENRQRENALKVYTEIINIYNKIPPIFLEDKKKIYVDEVLPLYQDIIKDMENNFFSNFSSEISKVDELLGLAKVQLKMKNVQKAVKTYNDCISLFNSLPEGYFLKKLELGSRILEIYKELTIIIEIADLEAILKNNEGPKDEEPNQQDRKISAVTEGPIIPPERPTSTTQKLSMESLKKQLVQRENAKEMYTGSFKGREEKNILTQNSEVTEETKKVNEILEDLDKSVIKEKPISSLKDTAKKLKEEKSGKRNEISQVSMTSSLKKELCKRKIERAKFRLKKGKIEDAKRDLNDVLRIDPENEEAKVLLGEKPKNDSGNVQDKLHKIKNDHQLHKTIQKIKEVAGHKDNNNNNKDLTPELVKRRLQRAVLRLKKGDKAKAIEDLKAALRLDPNNEKVKELLDNA